MVTWSPCFSSMRPLPSNAHQAVAREDLGTDMRRSMESLRSMGRNDKVCGQIGVNRMAGMSGWTREPPAEREYAVEPGYVSLGWQVIESQTYQ